VLGFRKLLNVHVKLYAAALLVDFAELRNDLLRIVHFTFVTLEALADIAKPAHAPIYVQHVFELPDLLVADLGGVGAKFASSLFILLLALQR
jgi:hypothetical protein